MPGVTRRALLGATLAAAATALLACGRAGTGASSPRGPTLALATGPDWTRAAEVVVSRYTAEGGRARETVVPARMPALIAAMLAGTPTTPPDVILVTPAVRSIWQATSLMHDLGPTLANTRLDATIYPSVLADGSFQGRQLVMPLFRDPLVVFYNADALARAGHNPPAPTWPLADLMDLCARLAANGTHPLLRSASVTNAELLTAFIIGFGGEVLAPGPAGGTGYVPAFTSARALAGLSALATLLKYVPPQGINSSLQTFAQGGAALFFGHYRDVAALESAIGSLFAWNVVSLPAFPARGAQPVQAEGLAAVSADPQLRTAAITLTLFGATSAGQTALARAGLGVPATPALAQSPLWRARTPLLDNDVFVANTADDVIVPRPLYFLDPQLDLALTASMRGVAVAEAFGAAATASEFTLANWPNP